MSQTEFISSDRVRELDGRVRVTFEGRTAWNATLVHADDGSLLRWIDTKNGPARDRDFELTLDDDLVFVPGKPTWGALTAITAR